MNKIILSIFLFFALFSFSQEYKMNYHFDYFTKYSYANNNERSNIKELFFSNSKDSTYIFIIKVSNDLIMSANLFDYKNLLIHKYSDHVELNNLDYFKNLNQTNTYKYNLKDCRRIKNYKYEITYLKVDNKNVINIKRFKKRKKKILVDESFYETTPTTITNSQHFNFGPLTNSLWCYKFQLKNNELITKSYYITHGKNGSVRELLEIKNIDYNLNINSIINTEN